MHTQQHAWTRTFTRTHARTHRHTGESITHIDIAFNVKFKCNKNPIPVNSKNKLTLVDHRGVYNSNTAECYGFTK